jgi:hypothetical protein
MRSSEVEGPVGKHSSQLTLAAGHKQSMTFGAGSEAIEPFWMTKSQQETTRKDKPSGKTRTVKGNAAAFTKIDGFCVSS